MHILQWKMNPERTSVRLLLEQGMMEISGITEDILRCVFTRNEQISRESPLGIRPCEKKVLEVIEDTEADKLLICTRRLLLEVDTGNARFTWYRRDPEKDRKKLLLREGGKELQQKMVQVWNTNGEEPLIRRVHTVDGDRNFIDNLKPVPDHPAFRARLFFDWQKDESIHGLGQGEEGIYDYRGHVQYLYQHNMRIPMPWLLSDRGYAILADCGSLMTFNDDERGSYLFLDAVQQLDYYFISGEKTEDLIRAYRYLTGKAAMLPKWAFGYVQSKERYDTQDELVDIAAEYRRRGVGLDCVVQDWKTWSGDRWGEKRLDPERFPDRKKMREQLHDLHVHSMVSVWPNMNYDTKDCSEMQERGFLLHDLATYDAFDPEARKLYWKQAEEGLYREGFDSWWCDSTEPFSGPDWGGEVMREPWERYRLVGDEHKKYLGEERANLYALYHARGIFENQTEADPEHRVLNLTRSGYAGIQQYGAMLWSGDTAASWKTLRKQLTESLNMALSGYPYWTFDTGAFFTVHENWQGRGCGCSTDPTPKWFWTGDFEEGVHDPGYRELYVRWLQMAVFLPMMRSHGTDTPREIWQFGEPGTKWYDAIEKAIALRYRLMPYLYSLAGSVWLEDSLIQRPLLMDFAEDKRAAGRSDAFMLGKSILVCPVTRPMEYGPGGQELKAGYTWNCYLPGGCSWYILNDEHGEALPGGQEISFEADLQTIPCFVRAGSILPMEQGLTYAQEEVRTPLEIRIWPGADAEFFLYEDDGDGNAYRDGKFNHIRLDWNEKDKTLTIGKAEHVFPGGIKGRRCRVICRDQVQEITCTGEEMRVSFA